MKNKHPIASVYYVVRDCSLGMMLLAWNDQGLCGLTLGDAADILISDILEKFPKAQFQADSGGFESEISEIVEFIENRIPTCRVRLNPQGTPFQRKVWHVLHEIPYGNTATYSDIAQKIGAPKAVRAVANACANNPLAILIPCHRVMGRNGKLCGYRWGIERKAQLLRREKLNASLVQLPDP